MQNKSLTKIQFTTINCENNSVNWEFTLRELNECYMSGIDIPDGDDIVTEFIISGIRLFVKKFDDIIDLLGFDGCIPDSSNCLD